MEIPIPKKKNNNNNSNGNYWYQSFLLWLDIYNENPTSLSYLTSSNFKKIMPNN